MAEREREVTFADLECAIERRDPQFAELVIRFVEQGDPPAGQPELPPDGDDEAGERARPPAPSRDEWTLDRLRSAVNPSTLASKTGSERKAARAEAWEALTAAKNPPPRLALGKLLTELYSGSDDEQWRGALCEIFAKVRLGWGVWQAFKQIYKLAEQRHDAALFGVLAWRLDGLGSRQLVPGEVQQGTVIYLRRRAWRYLRQLGETLPELFVPFAAQVLKHYPEDLRSFSGLWIANRIWGYGELREDAFAMISGPPKNLKQRAFDEAWKLTPAPLLRLIEDASNDTVCSFGIRCLQQDFKETLRDVSPEWITRIGNKRLSSVDGFIVKLLGDTPEFHQSKLRGLGLHEAVLGLLRSPSSGARKYAIEYARAHAPDIPVAVLLELAGASDKEVRELVAIRLEKLPASELGAAALARLVGVVETEKLAASKLGELGADLDQATYLTLALGNQAQRKYAEEHYKATKREVPAAYLCALLEDERRDHSSRTNALKALGKCKGTEIGVEWLKRALLEGELRTQVMGWLRGGMLKGDALDVEWLKGLTMRPQLRGFALEMLGNRKLVTPSRVGLPWLLAMARQADEGLHQFAHRYLLEHFAPADFAAEGSDGIDAGVARLWALVGGKDEPEAVREFASLYLRVHHPTLGPTLKEAKSLGISPKLPRESYTAARVEPLVSDPRADVRRFAAAIVGEDLVRWGEVALLYRLADSPYREGRGAAAAALLAIAEPETSGADADRVPSAEWLRPSDVFALGESPHKATREVALTLIRRHYGTLGGAERLAWLMESPDREVRLFAARLLWERHRPLGTAESWRPAKGEGFGADGGTRRFDSSGALTHFMRTVMFGLPPGRMERREVSDGKGALPDRPLAASIAKQRVLGVVRDLAVEDETFAAVAVPVLEEFMHSQAKGEWQGCVAALAAIRQAHPNQPMALAAGTIEERPLLEESASEH